MMAIYQIYIQGKNINGFYNKMNHTTFQKLFFDTINSVINLIDKQPDDVISSKDDQASEYQGETKLEYIHKINNQMMLFHQKIAKCLKIKVKMH